MTMELGWRTRLQRRLWEIEECIGKGVGGIIYICVEIDKK